VTRRRRGRTGGGRHATPSARLATTSQSLGVAVGPASRISPGTREPVDMYGTEEVIKTHARLLHGSHGVWRARGTYSTIDRSAPSAGLAPSRREERRGAAHGRGRERRGRGSQAPASRRLLPIPRHEKRDTVKKDGGKGRGVAGWRTGITRGACRAPGSGGGETDRMSTPTTCRHGRGRRSRSARVGGPTGPGRVGSAVVGWSGAGAERLSFIEDKRRPGREPRRPSALAAL